jgi:hypothetical protein
MNIAPLAGKSNKESGEEGMRRKGKSARLSGTAGKNNPLQGAKYFPALVLALVCLAPAVFATGLVLGNFSAEDLAGWKPKRFRGKTSYSFVVDGERRVLKAHSRAAASGLYKEVDLDPAKYPVLRWSWKIGGTIPNGDERTKGGDDYAARVYIVFPRTFF